MMDLIIDVPAEIVEQILEAFRKDGRIPWVNETVATEGYPNVLIGMAPPSLFGHTITFKIASIGDTKQERQDIG